jgi:7,8-dihydropterin-6-yl-methyl-4-(beta-D-ribofuranosyl)aminobenzene 5'-phosphate synthase
MSQKISLPKVDEVKITVVMDNSIDLLMASSDVAKRFPLAPNQFERVQPMAQHGFSALIRVRQNDKSGVVLFDTGVTRSGILHNMDVFEIDARDIQAIVLSHGHADHALGLPGLIERLGNRNLPLVLHPDAYLERKVILPNGFEISLPPPRKSDLRQENIEIIEEAGPSMLADGMLLVSGEVARTTEFEKGFPIHFAHRHASWEPDPLIMDDQCVIMNIRDEGLAIVTGCGHAGIINIIRNAQALTGIHKIYAVIGGFHLSGAIFEPIIAPTIAALQSIQPQYIMPGHCTGWSATHQIARTLPQAFIPNSVGTTILL